MFGVMVEEEAVVCRRGGRKGKIIYTNKQARQPDSTYASALGRKC